MRQQPAIEVNSSEVDFTAVRAQGPGGQNVHKVSSAAHLRFDIHASSLPEAVKARLLGLGDQRIGADGTVVIKAQTHRSLPRNQADALSRLQALVDMASVEATPRVPTRPTRASKRRRLAGKAQRSEVKAGRQRVRD